MIIREFIIEDYDSLITLWDYAKLPFKPKGRDRRDKIEYELKQGRNIFLVAEINGKLVGSVFGTHDGRKGWINRLAVSPEFQRQDVAKKLVAEVENRFSELGIDIIACLVEGWNTKSLKVFKKLGYKMHSDISYFSKRKDPNV